MVSLAELWLPVLVAAVFVFLGSAVIHMLLPIHRNDHEKLPGEEAVLASMREAGVRPGDYFFPHCESPSQLAEPEVKAKFDAGPVGTMTVIPSGLPAMGRNLMEWFVYSIVLGAFVAWVASLTLPAGAGFFAVFRLAAIVAFLGYAGSEAQRSVWWGRSWKTTAKLLGDGLAYGLLTGLAFAWLWPA